MEWNKHFGLNVNNMHAFLGGSKYSWLNYDDQKLITSYANAQAAKDGTELHAWVADTIRKIQKFGKKYGIDIRKKRKTIPMYVADALKYNMRTEQLLYYSENCFGTADSISFENNLLRIHDLKTGTTPAHMEQLEIYAALFCLEYQVDPGTIKIELRIYQNDDIEVANVTKDDVLPIMEKIIRFDDLINTIKNQGLIEGVGIQK